MFTSIFSDTGIAPSQEIASLLIAFVLGLVISVIYRITSTDYSKNFANSLILIPALIGAVITLVNGDTGSAVAVMGAFSLIRFRSIQGTSKDLTYILFAMTIGLAMGRGYAVFSTVLTVLVSLVLLLLHVTKYGIPKTEKKELRITIPENLDYTGIFDDIFAQYTTSAELVRVRTTNLGSMYELQYHTVIKDPKLEKEMIDAIRTRNGNLDIVCGKMSFNKEAL